MVPPGPTYEAPVGHTLTQGASSQWLQRCEVISMVRLGNCPFTTVWIQSRLKPSATLFSVLQAVTHAVHPTQVRVSMAMA